MAIRNEMKLRLMNPVPMARAYEGDAGRSLAVRYESLDPEKLHADILHCCHPRLPASVIDIGAGSGRDAAWFASKGYSVLAVEPSATMREEGRRRHPDLGNHLARRQSAGLIRRSTGLVRRSMWHCYLRSGCTFRRMIASERSAKVVNLLKPNGMIVMRSEDRLIRSTRTGHASCLRRGDWPPCPGTRSGRANREACPDDLARSPWRHEMEHACVLKFPDDGTGALPQSAACHPERREEHDLQARPSQVGCAGRRRLAGTRRRTARTTAT